MKSEFQFLETIKRRHNLTKIGDDCAVLPKDSQTDLVITTDLLVEDVDFRREWSNPEFVGHKALAVSLSDVAAMGAKPVWALLSIGVPEAIWRTDFVEKFYEGYMKLADEFAVELIGGDVSRTTDKIVVDSIVAGEVGKNTAITRSNANVGDLIFVTGTLGAAAGGLRILENKINAGDTAINSRFENLIRAQLQPAPHVAHGEFLRRTNAATAMIDLSDGLSGDLAHLCRASEVGAKLFVERIPVHRDLDALTGDDREKLDFALHGGEDYRLLFTVKPSDYQRLKIDFERLGFVRIGEITAPVGVIELERHGRSEILDARGFQHF